MQLKVDKKARSCASKAEYIKALRHELKQLLDENAAFEYKCGKLLLEIKAQLKHGQWLPWLASNFALTPRSAELYMKQVRAKQKGSSATST